METVTFVTLSPPSGCRSMAWHTFMYVLGTSTRGDLQCQRCAYTVVWLRCAGNLSCLLGMPTLFLSRRLSRNLLTYVVGPSRCRDGLISGCCGGLLIAPPPIDGVIRVCLSGGLPIGASSTQLAVLYSGIEYRTIWQGSLDES